MAVKPQTTSSLSQFYDDIVFWEIAKNTNKFFVTFEEGLSETIDWYLNNENWLKNVTSGNYQNYYNSQYK